MLKTPVLIQEKTVVLKRACTFTRLSRIKSVIYLQRQNLFLSVQLLEPKNYYLYIKHP